MALVFVTFLVTTVLYGGLIWWGMRRVIRHLQGNAEGVKAVTEHVLVPLLGRRLESAEKPAEVKKIKGTLV